MAPPWCARRPGCGAALWSGSRWRPPPCWPLPLWGLNPLPGPQILGLEGAGRVLVDGREFSAADRAGLDQALRAGSRVELGPEVTLDLIYPGSMAMRLEAGTEMTLPGRPGRWFHRSVEADLPLGELSLRTGPRLKGGQVLVSTPEGLTTVRGTLISVFRNPDVTCVCLFEGSASVAVGGQDLGRLDPQKRWVMFSDGSEPALMAIEPGHRDHMLSFDEKWRHELGLE